MATQQPIGPAEAISLSKIDIFGDVGFRIVLDQENLEKLARLRECGEELDPIKVMKTSGGRFRLISGNHRRQIAINRGETEIMAFIYSPMSELEFTLMGIQENAGKTGKNPLPPTEEDLRMNIRNLLKLKQTPNDIVKAFPHPERYIRNLIVGVQATVLKQRKQDAMDYLAKFSSLSVNDVAPRFGLKPSQLQDTIKRKKKRLKNYDTHNPAKNDIAKLGNRLAGFSRSFGVTTRAALKELSEGTRDQKSVITVLNHVETLLKKYLNDISNARLRATNLG